MIVIKYFFGASIVIFNTWLVLELSKSGYDSFMVIASLISLILNNVFQSSKSWEDKFNDFIGKLIKFSTESTWITMGIFIIFAIVIYAFTDVGFENSFFKNIFFSIFVFFIHWLALYLSSKFLDKHKDKISLFFATIWFLLLILYFIKLIWFI